MIKFTKNNETPFNPAQIVQTAYHAVNKTGLYSLALKECHKKAMVEEMLASFRIIFQRNIMIWWRRPRSPQGAPDSTKTTRCKRSRGALKHLAMETGTDKDIVAKLT